MTILTMCEKNFKKFWCYALLLLVVSSKSVQNFTRNEEENDNITMGYELESTTNYGDKMNALRYDVYEKSTNNTQYGNMQYESRITSNNDDDSIQYKLSTLPIQNHVDDKQIPMESQMNSTNVNYKRNFTSQEISRNLMNVEDKNNSTSHEFFKNSIKNSNINNIVSYETCQHDNIICIQLCCSLGDRLQSDECIPEKIKYFLPNVYGYTNGSLQSENKIVDELFPLTIYDPCLKTYRFLFPYVYRYDYMFFPNGSLYLNYYKIFVDKLMSYCLAIIDGDKFEVTICLENFVNLSNIDDINNKSLIRNANIIHMSFHIVSILFLVSVFLVYSIFPDLRNVHAFMLRNYSGALSIANTIDIVNILIKTNDIVYPICITIDFLHYFFFLTSSFWLNIMSVDMWWTFRRFYSLQRNVKKTKYQENKKLIFYTLCAWGLPFILAIISIIILIPDFVSEHLRPQFRAGNCWFAGKGQFSLYYYGIRSICIISSICLSISTAVKIARYEKDTSHRLTDSESKRYNDNKKWNNVYLKLFIMLFILMSIKWYCHLTIILSENITTNRYYAVLAIHLLDVVQNFCTFTIFVWKKKIKQMLLKRFGCGICLEAQSTTNVSSSSASTCTTSGEMSIQKNTSSLGQRNHHVEDSLDETKL